MPVTRHNPKELFPQYRCYSHAMEIHGDSRLLVISGLNGYLSDGKTMPESCFTLPLPAEVLECADVSPL